MIAMHVRFCRFDAMPWLLLGGGARLLCGRLSAADLFRRRPAGHRGHPAAVLRVLAALCAWGARRRGPLAAGGRGLRLRRRSAGHGHSPDGRPWPPLAWPWAGSRVSFWAR